VHKQTVNQKRRGRFLTTDIINDTKYKKKRGKILMISGKGFHSKSSGKRKALEEMGVVCAAYSVSRER